MTKVGATRYIVISTGGLFFCYDKQLHNSSHGFKTFAAAKAYLRNEFMVQFKGRAI